jgi:flagellar protein FlbD
VIRLTRLNSQPVTLNSDLIKFVESNPDTVITLVSGDKILVHETPDDVLAQVIKFRRDVISGLLSMATDPCVAVAAGSNAQREQGIVSHPGGKSRG